MHSASIHENNLQQACKRLFNQRDLQLPQRDFSMSRSAINDDQNWSASLQLVVRDLQRVQPTWQSCLPRRGFSLQNGLQFQTSWYGNLQNCHFDQKNHQPIGSLSIFIILIWIIRGIWQALAPPWQNRVFKFSIFNQTSLLQAFVTPSSSFSS